MTLSVDALRLRVTSSLGDEALTGLLEAAYEAIDNYAGMVGDVQERLMASGMGPLLMLSRRAIAIESVTENDVALAADDYELRSSGQMLLRLTTGTNSRRYWFGPVDVTYQPYVDDAERDRVAGELVQLDLNYKPGLTSERIGDWEEQFARNDLFNYQTERAAILASLSSAVMIL